MSEEQDAADAEKALHRALGEIALFLGQTEEGEHLFLSELRLLVLPPVLLRQYKLVKGPEDATVGFIAWASVGKEVEKRLLAGARLRPSEWRSGERMVVAQLFCPAAVRKLLLGGIRRDFFQDRELYVVEDAGTAQAHFRLVEPLPAEEG